MKKKIVWVDFFYLLNLIILILTYWFNSDNLANCWITKNYHVWICNLSLTFYIFHLTLTIWLIWSLYMLFDLFIFEWEDNITYLRKGQLPQNKKLEKKIKELKDKILNNGVYTLEIDGKDKARLVDVKKTFNEINKAFKVIR